MEAPVSPHPPVLQNRSLRIHEERTPGDLGKPGGKAGKIEGVHGGEDNSAEGAILYPIRRARRDVPFSVAVPRMGAPTGIPFRRRWAEEGPAATILTGLKGTWLLGTRSPFSSASQRVEEVSLGFPALDGVPSNRGRWRPPRGGPHHPPPLFSCKISFSEKRIAA